MKFFVSALTLLVIGSCTAGSRADDKVNVEVWLATEHVPKDLKAGMMVDLSWVRGKTQTSGGVVSYSTSVVTRGCEVVSVTHVEKPKEPEQAVKVEIERHQKPD
jgi:hypothetical protein